MDKPHNYTNHTSTNQIFNELDQAIYEADLVKEIINNADEVRRLSLLARPSETVQVLKNKILNLENKLREFRAKKKDGS